MQASLARSETQVIRYKSTADAAEKVESELKIERRKLQREVTHTFNSFGLPTRQNITELLAIHDISSSRSPLLKSFILIINLSHSKSKCFLQQNISSH